jgi:hypothetical protein
MLNTTSEKRQFLHKDFKLIWEQFNTNEEILVVDFLNQKLKSFIKEKILKGVDLLEFCNDTRKISHYERVWLWSILEYLNAEKELHFNDSICQFWEYPNLRVIINESMSDKNNFEIGNLLLGTSYYNNKSGWVSFDKYPLMKKLHKSREKIAESDIEIQTQSFKSQLQKLLS